MGVKILAFVLFVITFKVVSQNIPEDYFKYVTKADSLYKIKKYKEAAFTYSEAFKSNNWKGIPEDRYNAACCWALANYPDSAFFNLNRITNGGNFTSYFNLTNDKDLNSLHGDARWQPFLDKVKKSREEAEAKLNKPLIKILDSINYEDQNYRLQIGAIDKQFGRNSRQMDSLWRIINTKDASNIKVVTSILDKYGWLGAEEVGNRGNSTLFLVIQHSDLATQQKYLPMMREAVKNGKAQSSSLALLEDRVALGLGKKQIYGSQISRHNNGEHFVMDLEDPDNVNKRRKEVGLQPLEDYVSHWNIKWNAEEYKKQNNAEIKSGASSISNLNITASWMLKWIVVSENLKEPFIIEQFRWNKWIKIGEVEALKEKGTHEYSFQALPHSGENMFRVSVANKVQPMDTIKRVYEQKEPTYTISKDFKEIKFSDKTFYEVWNMKKKLIKKGFANTISIDNLPKGDYQLFYDNVITSFAIVK